MIADSIDPSVLSSYSKTISSRERVAQPVEHLTFNQEAAGSSPAALTNNFRNLCAMRKIIPQ